MSDYDLDKLLQTFINPCIPGFQTVDGYLLGHRYNEIQEGIENFEVNDSDIWVCTYPKAGTTWTQEMVWLIANDFDYEGAKENVAARFPFIEMEMIYDCKEVEKARGMPGEIGDHIKHSFQFTKNLKSHPRCIKTHLPWNLLPKSIRNKEKRPRIIAVVRDPKDTCVSFYHHHKLLHFYNGTFDEFVTMFLNDKVLFSPFWGNVESYWKQQNEPNVLIIRYADMKKDLRSVVVEVANFLGKPVPEDQMDKLLHHLSFNAMKNNTATNYVNTEQGSFIRKGTVGDYKNEMSPEIIKKFEKWTQENNRFGVFESTL